jgi:hypothetical protein
VNIEQFLASPKSLITLCQDVVAALDTKRKGAGLDEKEKQLKEISHSIEKLESLGVPVPEQLRSLKSAIITELSVTIEIDHAFEELAKGFRNILEDLCVRVDGSGEKPKGPKIIKKHSKQPKTNREILRAEIIHALKTMGGKGKPREVEAVMEQRLKGRFLPRDLQKLNSGYIVWKNTAEWERFRMIQDGILRNDSPNGVWELTKESL